MPKSDHDDLAALGRIGHHAEIDFAFDQVFVNLVGAQVLQMHVYLRISAQELGEVGRQLVQPDAVTGPTRIDPATTEPISRSRFSNSTKRRTISLLEL